MNAGQLILLATYLTSSMALIGCGLLLYRRKVGRNRWFGFRTKLTMSDDALWYSANRVAGFWLIVTGFGTAAVALVTSFIGINAAQSATLVTSGYVAGITICVLASSAEQRQWNDSPSLEQRPDE